ncbi:MAG: hypothetical protein JWO25_2138 [Alphaproteobacteria bacterium]|nr:hypothetical protein [Alphaproteobacteria bacterium]
MASSPRFDLPTIESETRPFWEAAKNGKLLLGKCNSCELVHYYPRPMCPKCWSEDVSFVPASGRGEIYTYSTVYVNDLPPFNARLPYVAAQVDLEEGVRITTNIVECEIADLEIGMPVELRFQAISEDVTIPVFAPRRS